MTLAEIEYQSYLRRHVAPRLAIIRTHISIADVAKLITEYLALSRDEHFDAIMLIICRRNAVNSVLPALVPRIYTELYARFVKKNGFSWKDWRTLPRHTQFLCKKSNWEHSVLDIVFHALSVEMSEGAAMIDRAMEAGIGTLDEQYARIAQLYEHHLDRPI